MTERNYEQKTFTVKTLSPLHIGTGELRSEPRTQINGTKIDVSIQEIAKDFEHKPYIPATQIKGAIRAIAENIISDNKTLMIQSLFGYQGETPTDGDAEGAGGKLIFENAYLESACEIETAEHVSINPHTGAAKSHHLFYMDYVPEGTEFKFDIVILKQDELKDNEKQAYKDIITHLEQHGIVLGGNTTNGYGICSVNGESVSDKTSDLVFDITLRFQTPFLVNDAKKAKEEYSKEGDPTAVYKSKGTKALLPASSFRGVLWHQFQRIARTKDKEIKEIKRKLFGYTDYKALLSFTDFVSEKDAISISIEQDFIAIDRFTGGTKESAKFKIKAVENPVLKGKIILNTQRYEKRIAKKEEEIKKEEEEKKQELELLLLTLRDLIEGDMIFGYGSSKGYGVCTAKITVNGQHDLKPKIEIFLDLFQPQKDKAA